MQIENTGAQVLVEKDLDNKLPIPTAWRSVIRVIVKAFVHQDYLLSSGIPRVATVSDDTATQIRDYMEEYGEILTELLEESWDTSNLYLDGGPMGHPYRPLDNL